MNQRFQVQDDWNELLAWGHVEPSPLPVAPAQNKRNDGRFHPVLRVSKLTGKRELVWMREGLIPSYACDERGAEQRTEAHAEALTCDSCFRSAFRRRRCLVPASRLMERRHISAGIEQPCFFELETGGLFALAALWETWTNDQGHAIESFAIVTTLVIPTLRSLFDRMPVVLTEREDQARWLEVSKDHDHPPAELMRPLSVAQLRAWRMTPGEIDLNLKAVESASHATPVAS